MDERKGPPARDTEKPRRKPYAPPSVSLLGDLADLTLGAEGSRSDHGRESPTKRGHG